jgi:tRNA/rRNA methyltransferase
METSHAGNVGAVARALKVMGFDDLVLVRPRWHDVLQMPEAVDRASGAQDVLARARVVASLDEALQGMTHVCATAMTPRDFGPPTRAPREHFADWAAGGWRMQGAAPRPADSGVAFVFGSERYGMRNEDVYRCHVCLSIPTAPAYGSLNLAAAVQLMAYEWRMALGWGELAAATESGSAPITAPPTEPLADAAAVAGLLAHWEEALVAVDFLKPAAPKKLLPRLNQLLNRAQPTEAEVHILRGVARAMLQTAARAKR